MGADDEWRMCFNIDVSDGGQRIAQRWRRGTLSRG